MKRLNLLYGLALLLAFGFAACNKKTETTTTTTTESSTEATSSDNTANNGTLVLSPETTKVKGDLGDYFEVVTKDYTFTPDEYNEAMVSIEVKRTDAEYGFDVEGVKPYRGTYSSDTSAKAGFGIELLDKNGNVIDKKSATNFGFTDGMYSGEDMTEALKLKPGETATIRWKIEVENGKAPAKFRLSSAYEGAKSYETKTASEEVEIESLDDAYNKAKKEYNDAYNKAQKEYNDAYNNAMKEYNNAYNQAAKAMGL